MYRSFLTAIATAVVLLGLAGCSDQTVAPDDATTLSAELVALDDFGFTWGHGPGAGCATGPGTCFGGQAGGSRSWLGGLVQEAYRTLVEQQGQAAADAAFATLWKLHQDAFALRAAGEQDAFSAAMAAAHQESVRLVLAVLGDAPAATAVQKAEEQLAALETRLAERAAAGLDVTRLAYVAAKAAEYLASAKAALAAGDAAAALDWGSRALQAATMGGGQAGSGPGAGSGSRQRQRNGR